MAIVDGKIRCSVCKELLALCNFQPAVVKRACGTCRGCKKVQKQDYAKRNPKTVNASRTAHRNRNLEHHRAMARGRYRKDPEMFRGYNLSKYGISAAEYDAMLAAQGGLCACCGVSENRNGKRLFVDHSHLTGEIRGLLCHACNAGVGLLGDNIEGVKRALAYLERAEPQCAPALKLVWSK